MPDWIVVESRVQTTRVNAFASLPAANECGCGLRSISIRRQSRSLMSIRAADLLVTAQKMLAERNRKWLDLVAELFFGQHVDGVFDRVGRNNFGVVAGGVGRFEI